MADRRVALVTIGSGGRPTDLVEWSDEVCRRAGDDRRPEHAQNLLRTLFQYPNNGPLARRRAGDHLDAADGYCFGIDAHCFGADAHRLGSSHSPGLTPGQAGR